jgi:hypothetical protein
MMVRLPRKSGVDIYTDYKVSTGAPPFFKSGLSKTACENIT